MDEKSIEKKEYTEPTSLEESRDETVPFVKSPAEKRYVRKLNMRLLPFAMTIVFLQVINKDI
jgi:hypothetical protein